MNALDRQAEERRARIIDAACDIAMAWYRDRKRDLPGNELRILVALRLYERSTDSAEHFLNRLGACSDALPEGIHATARALYNAGILRGNRPGRPQGARQEPLTAAELANVRDLTLALGCQMPAIEDALTEPPAGASA